MYNFLSVPTAANRVPSKATQGERYLSEDYYFSRLWSKIGGKIWADISMPLQHQGMMHFNGHVGTLFSLANGTDKNTTKTGDTKTDQ